MKRILLLSSFLFCALFGQLRMKRVAFLNSGLYNETYGRIVCGDINHNGLNELVFKTRENIYPFYQRWEIWEYRPINQYELVYVDTGWPAYYPSPPMGIETGNLAPFAVEYLDQDSSYDLTGMNKEGVPGGNIPLTTVQEGPSSSSYPINLVWFDRLTGPFNTVSHYITDLDRDGRKEMFLKWYDGDRVYENTANNQFIRVFTDPPSSWATYAFGDFDLDGRMEIAFPCPDNRVYIRECTDNNQYPVVASYPAPQGLVNGHDCWDGRDVDNDGRPEFFIAFWTAMSGRYYLYMWEATGDNTYEETFIDQINGGEVCRLSACGDIDGDGIEEIVWSVGQMILIYKSTGNNQFQRVLILPGHSGQHPVAIITICDMNKNGYNEIVSGGKGKTSIFEVEAVQVLTPNGGETFSGNSQELIQWQKFYPPRCDSLSLFYSINNGTTYLPLASCISASDSSYLWTVPNNINSDSCKVKIIAYGSGWQYDESDGIFRISSTGIEEEARGMREEVRIRIYPNPAKTQSVIRYTIPVEGKVSLNLYDISGRLIKTLVNENKKPGNYKLTLNTKTLSAGVYFLSLETQEKRIIERLVIVR